MAKLPECAKKLGGSHAMLISGPTLRKMGIVDKAADYLKEAAVKHIEGDITIDDVRQQLKSYVIHQKV